MKIISVYGKNIPCVFYEIRKEILFEPMDKTNKWLFYLVKI